MMSFLTAEHKAQISRDLSDDVDLQQTIARSPYCPRNRSETFAQFVLVFVTRLCFADTKTMNGFATVVFGKS